MAASDRDDVLDRLINAEPSESPDADADLRELAALAQTLQASGRDHARQVDPVAGWAALSAAIDQTPQARPNRLLGWLRGAAAALQPQFAPFPAIASAAVVLGVSLLLAMPQENASAALLRDVDAIERTVASASAQGGLSDHDLALLERTATAVLDRVADDATLRTVSPAQAEAIVVRLDDARRTLSALPDTASNLSVNALVTLSAASGLVESSLSALVPPTATAAPPKAAQRATPKPTASPTPAPVASVAVTPTVSPTPRPARTEDRPSPTPSPTPAPTRAPSSARDGRSGEGGVTNRATPAPTPSVATLLDTVNRTCASVYDTGSLGGCRKAVEAAELWCDRLGGSEARGCSAALTAPLQAAERRVTSLADSCKQLTSSKSQQACRDTIEKSTNRTSRGSSGNTGRGDRGD